METLGARGPVSAIGCAIRTERMLAARAIRGRRVMARSPSPFPPRAGCKEACDAWFADAGLKLEQTAGRARLSRRALPACPVSK